MGQDVDHVDKLVVGRDAQPAKARTAVGEADGGSLPRGSVDHRDTGRHVAAVGPVQRQVVGHKNRLAVGSDRQGDRLADDRHAGDRLPSCQVDHRHLVIEAVGHVEPLAVGRHGKRGRMTGWQRLEDLARHRFDDAHRAGRRGTGDVELAAVWTQRQAAGVAATGTVRATFRAATSTKRPAARWPAPRRASCHRGTLPGESGPRIRARAGRGHHQTASSKQAFIVTVSPWDWRTAVRPCRGRSRIRSPAPSGPATMKCHASRRFRSPTSSMCSGLQCRDLTISRWLAGIFSKSARRRLAFAESVDHAMPRVP